MAKELPLSLKGAEATATGGRYNLHSGNSTNSSDVSSDTDVHICTCVYVCICVYSCDVYVILNNLTLCEYII